MKNLFAVVSGDRFNMWSNLVRGCLMVKWPHWLTAEHFCMVTYMNAGFIELWQPKGKLQGGHSPGKPGIVREFKSGQGKVREKGKVRESVFLHVATYRAYCS